MKLTFLQDDFMLNSLKINNGYLVILDNSFEYEFFVGARKMTVTECWHYHSSCRKVHFKIFKALWVMLEFDILTPILCGEFLNFLTQQCISRSTYCWQLLTQYLTGCNCFPMIFIFIELGLSSYVTIFRALPRCFNEFNKVHKFQDFVKNKEEVILVMIISVCKAQIFLEVLCP